MDWLLQFAGTVGFTRPQGVKQLLFLNNSA
jgi:hypothetical protein